MTISVYVDYCDLENTKNNEIMDILDDELRSMGGISVFPPRSMDGVISKFREFHFHDDFNVHEEYKVLEMARVANKRFQNNDEYVVVYARVNF